MATLDEMEQEPPPLTDEKLEALKKDFLNQYAYPYNRTKLAEALDRMLQHVRTSR